MEVRQKSIQEVQLGKIPPQSVDIEETVLGALMLERDSLNIVADILKPESFYKESHSKIYEAIVQLFNKSEPVDLMTVTAQLRKNGTLEIVGGPYQVAELTTKVNSAANIEYHARIISECAMKRDLINISGDIHNKCYDDTEDVFNILEEADIKINNVTESNTKGSFVNFDVSIDQTLKTLYEAKDKELTGVPSGFTDLDKITGGWQDTDLIIVAARPGMGKTAYCVSCAINAVKLFNMPVAIFSLEMSSHQLNQRILSHESEIPSDKIKRAKLSNDEWTHLHDTKKQISSWPLYIDDTGGLNITELKAKARRIKQNKGIKLLIIDYLQLLSNPEKKSREQEISSISGSLKSLAKELKIPIIALSQLSRAVESRGGDKKPMLSDLRDSGSIEQDADMVQFLYRPEYYIDNPLDESGNTLIGKGMVIIAKHRHGALDDVYLLFKGQFTKWQDDNIFQKSLPVIDKLPNALLADEWIERKEPNF